MTKLHLICCLGVLLCVAVAFKKAEPPQTTQLPSPSSVIQSQDIPKPESDTFEFFSLEPHSRISELRQGRFHGYEVLGKITVSEKKEQARLLAEMKKGIVTGKKAGRSSANCFEPRHGIHIVENGRITDYVICFACWGRQKYVNNDFVNNTVISDLPEPFFDAMLSKAGIPLAAKFYKPLYTQK